MPQSLHQRQALEAVVRRRLRGLPSTAPTRNGAFAAAPSPAVKPAGGAGSSSPASPATPRLAQLAGFVVVVMTEAAILYSLTADLWVTR